MIKTLLRHVGKISETSHENNIENISKITISIKSSTLPKLEIYSVEEISNSQEKKLLRKYK